MVCIVSRARDILVREQHIFPSWFSSEARASSILLHVDVSFQKRLKEVETFGVSGHKQAKEVLRDMGQGLK